MVRLLQTATSAIWPLVIDPLTIMSRMVFRWAFARLGVMLAMKMQGGTIMHGRP
jgi:hypothetical protein